MAKVKIQGLNWEWDPTEISSRAKDLDAMAKEGQGDQSEEGKKGLKEREAVFMKAWGGKSGNKKPDEKKAEDKSPFASVKSQIRDLQSYLKKEGIEYFPLEEFSQKVEQWEKEISLKESDAGDLGLEDKFSEVRKSTVALADEVNLFRSKNR